MDKLEENVTIRAITGGCFHRRSLIFHIEHDGRYLQYTLNHINSKTMNLRCLRHQKKGCGATLTIGFSDCIHEFIEVRERQHGNRTRFVMHLKKEAYTCPEVRNTDNFWPVSGKMSHWHGCVVDLNDSKLDDLYKGRNSKHRPEQMNFRESFRNSMARNPTSAFKTHWEAAMTERFGANPSCTKAATHLIFQDKFLQNFYYYNRQIPNSEFIKHVTAQLVTR